MCKVYEAYKTNVTAILEAIQATVIKQDRQRVVMEGNCMFECAEVFPANDVEGAVFVKLLPSSR